MQTANERQQRGQIIAQVRRNLKRINKLTYRVKSQTNGNYYHVRTTKIGWSCECPDYKFRGVKCKHIYAVEISPSVKRGAIDALASNGKKSIPNLNEIANLPTIDNMLKTYVLQKIALVNTLPY